MTGDPFVLVPKVEYHKKGFITHLYYYIIPCAHDDYLLRSFSFYKFSINITGLFFLNIFLEIYIIYMSDIKKSGSEKNRFFLEGGGGCYFMHLLCDYTHDFSWDYQQRRV